MLDLGEFLRVYGSGLPLVVVGLGCLYWIAKAFVREVAESRQRGRRMTPDDPNLSRSANEVRALILAHELELRDKYFDPLRAEIKETRGEVKEMHDCLDGCRDDITALSEKLSSSKHDILNSVTPLLTGMDLKAEISAERIADLIVRVEDAKVERMSINRRLIAVEAKVA